jgi:hypothetical protein
VGVDTYALLVDWEPTVAAYRRCGGMDFPWDASPYVATRTLSPGSLILSAWDYYRWLRATLPPELLHPAALFLDMLSPWDPRPMPGEQVTGAHPDDVPVDHIPVDDLHADAGYRGLRRYRGLAYSMRPETVRQAVRRADLVRWDDIEVAAELMDLRLPPPPDHRGHMDADLFVSVVIGQHRQWLADAAALDRGMVMIVSQ